MTMPVQLEITDEDREVLERRVGVATMERRDRQRAKIVLLAAEPVSSPKIAEIVGVNKNQMNVWKHHFRDDVARVGAVDRTPLEPPTTPEVSTG